MNTVSKWTPVREALKPAGVVAQMETMVGEVKMTAWASTQPHHEKLHFSITTSTGGDTESTSKWAEVLKVFPRASWPTQIWAGSKGEKNRTPDPALQAWADGLEQQYTCVEEKDVMPTHRIVWNSPSRGNDPVEGMYTDAAAFLEVWNEQDQDWEHIDTDGWIIWDHTTTPEQGQEMVESEQIWDEAENRLITKHGLDREDVEIILPG